MARPLQFGEPMVPRPSSTTMGAFRSLARWLCAGVATVGGLTLPFPALAGPPYVTDDPEPVDYRHWEFYVASFVERDAEGWTGTSPHLEVNYGLVPELQVHVLVPLAFDSARGAPARWGLGDTEVGVKWRFVRESRVGPQVGVFPLLEIPTGDGGRGLGNGSAQVFLPIWVQKSFGPLTSYAGGGAWLDSAPGARNWVYLGWQAQWRVVDALAIGGEVFYETPKLADGEPEARLDVGFVLDLSDRHHVIGSAGRGFVGPNLLQAYLAWLVTLGPAAEADGDRAADASR